MAFASPYTLELAPTLSGHWYNVFKGREALGYMPSATTILHAYPQSPQLTKWIAQNGYHESQRIKNEAGKRGTRVHNAIEDLLNGERLSEEGYSLEEWHKICVFADWYKEHKPKVLAIEFKVVSEEHKYAGTADLICEVNGELYVMDWKGLALDTPIPTPVGWSIMKDLEVGDQVIGANGEPCSVLGVSVVHHRDCYRITFDDKTSIVADNEHLWQTVSSDTGKTQILRTDELSDNILGRGKARRQRHLTIPNAAPIELASKDLPIDPYVFGCWLGDGARSGGKITALTPTMRTKIESRGYAVGLPHGKDTQKAETRTVFGLGRQLRLAGLQDLPAKTVPKDYLRGSIEQRLDLLQGVMDSDGTWNKKRNQAVFDTTTEELADVVAELALSLGQRISRWTGPYKGFGLTVTVHRVSFRPTGIRVFTTPKKAEQADNAKVSAKASRRLIYSVEKIPTVPTKCISVNSPDNLYLAGRQMVPTHNTSSNIHKNYHLQFAAYAQAFEEMTGKKVMGTGGVQLGAKNKKGFRMVSAEREEWKYNFQKFLNVYETWKYDWGYDSHTGKIKTPPVLVLPKFIKLDL